MPSHQPRFAHFALDTAIGRVDYLADDDGSGGVGSHLSDYSYLGLSSILSQADGDGVTLTDSLDQFGRIAEMNWVKTSTSSSTDDFQYAYDRDSNVLYKKNLLSSTFSELYHANSATSGDNNAAYDNLNRLQDFTRGTLSSSGNNGSTPSNQTHLAHFAPDSAIGGVDYLACSCRGDTIGDRESNDWQTHFFSKLNVKCPTHSTASRQERLAFLA